ncbi:MAG: hypothetical protein QOI30_558, partial [Mycobacterium sp.]|nr:hypothetical protein [Mycobacterium sp.]
QARGRGATMIFTRTKRTAQKVADELAERGFSVGAVHGDLGQIAREKALKAFRSGGIDVLVATDVAARGIDVDDVTHVINYQIPEDEQAYVHRIGRTGRAGKSGVAVTLVDWDELPRWTMIDKALGLGCPNPAETYSNSPHIYLELDIPTEVQAAVGAPRKSPAKKTTSSGGRNGDQPAQQRSSNSSRQRRRTRGGQTGTGHPATSANGKAETESPSTGTANEPSGDGTARRRRRRPRKSAGVTASAN